MVAQRDDRGRFVPGHPGGPGRPKRETEGEYLKTLQEVVTVDAWRLIVERAVADAIEGDPKARSWIGNYLLGLPSQRLEVDHQGDSDKQPITLAFLREIGSSPPPIITSSEIRRLAQEE